MYSLDVNFLNDRPEYKPDAAARTRVRAAPTDSRRPLILGLLALIALLAIPGALLWFLQSRNTALEQRQADLDSQLGDLKSKQEQINSVRAETKQVKDETTALASVFNTIKPWSAVMQDFRDRIPPGVQILRVKQVPPPPGQPQPTPSPQQTGAATPPVNGTIEISGVANSFNDVNDFLLVLQKSDFLNPKETRLLTSELPKEAPSFSNLSLQGTGSGSSSVDSNKLPKLPRLVGFTIQTTFNDVPASDLLQELEKKTAVGLVTRIEELQRKGVIRK